MRRPWKITISLGLLVLGGCANDSATSNASRVSPSASPALPGNHCGVNTVYAGDSPTQTTAQKE